MFAVMVRFHIRAEERERVLHAMRDVAVLMRELDGMHRFDVLDEDGDPEHPSFYEVWTDRALWEAHMGNRPPDIAALATRIAAAFAGPPIITTYATLD